MIKFHIRRSWSNFGLEILISEERDQKIYVAKKIDLDFVPLKEDGTYTSPTLFLPHFMADQFLKALAEELDNQGVKTENDAKIKGTLEATRYHLEDLRNLLKLK